MSDEVSSKIRFEVNGKELMFFLRKVGSTLDICSHVEERYGMTECFISNDGSIHSVGNGNLNLLRGTMMPKEEESCTKES